MRGVRPRRADHGIRDAAERPVAASALDTADEVPIGELARIEPIPETAGAAKIRDARLGADPGAREGDAPAGAGEQLRQPSQIAAHRRNRFQTRTATLVSQAPSAGPGGARRKPNDHADEHDGAGRAQRDVELEVRRPCPTWP